jgi:hypothetical protein
MGKLENVITIIAILGAWSLLPYLLHRGIKHGLMNHDLSMLDNMRYEGKDAIVKGAILVLLALAILWCTFFVVLPDISKR